MRHIALFVLACAVLAGCASTEPTWRVRDAHGWPLQTWETSSGISVISHQPRCVSPQYPYLVRYMTDGNLLCCDQPVSLNSYGPRAAVCGGEHTIERPIARGTAVVKPHYIQSAPITASSSAAFTSSSSAYAPSTVTRSAPSASMSTR